MAVEGHFSRARSGASPVVSVSTVKDEAGSGAGEVAHPPLSRHCRLFTHQGCLLLRFVMCLGSNYAGQFVVETHHHADDLAGA